MGREVRPVALGWEHPLIAFVKARLDEDEAAATAGARRLGMPWHAEPQPGTPGGLVIDELGLVATTGGRYAAEHIARHDPARVLREVAAKRRVLAAYADCVDASEVFREKLGTGTHMAAAAESYANVIRWDAAVWSDHPAYRAEWAP